MSAWNSRRRLKKFFFAFLIGGTFLGAVAVRMFDPVASIVTPIKVASPPHESSVLPVVVTESKQLNHAPSAKAQGSGVNESMRRDLRAASYGNPYPVLLAAIARGTPEDMVVARQIINFCLGSLAISTTEVGTFDIQYSKMLGAENDISKSGGLIDNAKSSLAARCQFMFDDKSLQEKVEDIRQSGLVWGLVNSGEFQNLWKGGDPDMSGQSLDDWLNIISSQYGYRSEAEPRYVDGVLWGGASSAEAYERAMRQAFINLSVDSSSTQAHIYSLQACAQTGICNAPIGQLMLEGVPADATQLRQDIARLTPIIQSAIEEGRIEAFRPPKVGK